MKKVIALFLVTSFVLFSCTNSKNKDDSKGFVPEEYTPSELAALMSKLLTDYGKAKDDIIEGKLPENRIDYTHKILSSDATDPNDINDLYKELADVFIKQANQYAGVQTDLDSLKTQHNLTIKTCIQCHTNFCGGPIVAIKKLYVP